jgi:AcrR family transcriptional regulator
MSARPPTLLRKDAQRNRAAILVAARELFADSGDVPMYEIARRAGVGQATLYRNFSDQNALVAALSSELLDTVEQLAAEHTDDPDAFFVVLRSLGEAQARFHGLGAFLRTGEGSELEVLKRRLVDLVKPPLRHAKAAGTVRRDLTVDDVMLLIAMIEGALNKAADRTGQAAAITRALALIVDGVTTRTSA